MQALFSYDFQKGDLRYFPEVSLELYNFRLRLNALIRNKRGLPQAVASRYGSGQTEREQCVRAVRKYGLAASGSIRRFGDDRNIGTSLTLCRPEIFQESAPAPVRCQKRCVNGRSA